ncbi:MAG TPA: maleylpyruvate isomerase family mycothiol-dependent enzyme [Acidimicrobiia bacterium]|nr:maleylpyruvate isomerase family mycothiol-dependent enzyme [Acidimicrobiia bacterium]
MDEVLSALAAQHAELAELIAPLDEAGWRRPTPCDGWDVADVVVHLTQTDGLALASVSGDFAAYLDLVAGELGSATSIDEAADLMVARARGRPGAAIRDEWQVSAGALRGAFAAGDLHARVQWVAGELAVATLATTRLAETWIHAGDVAAALGITREPTDRCRHIARLAWRTLPYAFANAERQLHGPVAFELRSPTETRWDFVPDVAPLTIIRGDAVELCRVAARRVDPAETELQGEGPDAREVLALVRTYA